MTTASGADSTIVWNRRSAALALRASSSASSLSRTSAPTARPVVERTIIENWSDSNAVLTSAELNGPDPPRVPHTATIEKRNVAPVAPREPNRRPAQTMSGTIVKPNGIGGIAEYTAGEKTAKQAAEIAVPRANSSRGPPAGAGSEERRNDINRGAMIRAPEASPSHHVFHTSPYEGQGTSPAAPKLVTPIVALTSGATSPAVRAKTPTVRALSNACTPLAKRRTKTKPVSASSALPVAMAADVAGVPAVSQFAAKAPTKTPGKSSGPHKSKTAIARPVGGQTGLELALSVAKRRRLPKATKA